MRLAVERLTADPLDRRRYELSARQFTQSHLTDYFLADSPHRDGPDRVFGGLRWGGQLVFISPRPREVKRLFHRHLARPEYRIDPPPPVVEPSRFSTPHDPCPTQISTRTNRFNLFRHRHMCFIARKILLDQPDTLTDRHSYHICLNPPNGGYVVLKQVPTLEQATRRSERLMPTASSQVIANNAHKLVKKVFPILLTREDAFLRMLDRHLPSAFQNRIPKLLKIEKDNHGLIRSMQISWLRLGGPPIGLLEFAQQSVELLRTLHEKIGLLHLDLRLENFVITEQGVGFVDFGSAARVDEDFAQNTILRILISEMLAASQIHKDLKRLQAQGV